MAGPIARLLAQALLIGGGVVIKAFVEAYQRVAANPEAAKAAADQARKTITRPGWRVMEEKEALQVLNLAKRPQSQAELIERYQKYFEANDPKRGGSLYVQSKVYRAREAIDRVMGWDSTSTSTTTTTTNTTTNTTTTNNSSQSSKKSSR
jgi:import inner membrane translocase subunit TIM16